MKYFEQRNTNGVLLRSAHVFPSANLLGWLPVHLGHFHTHRAKYTLDVCAIVSLRFLDLSDEQVTDHLTRCDADCIVECREVES